MLNYEFQLKYLENQFDINLKRIMMIYRSHSVPTMSNGN